MIDNKKKIYKLINEIPKNRSMLFFAFLENFIKKSKNSRFFDLYNDPLEIKSSLNIPSRAQRNAR